MTTPADTFNTVCSEAKAALTRLNTICAEAKASADASQKARAKLADIAAAHKTETDRYAAAQAAQDAAIRASITDESVLVPRLDRGALDVAERKLAIAQGTYAEAQKAEREAKARIDAAKASFEAAQGAVHAEQLAAEVSKLKHIGAYLGMLASSAASAAVYDYARFRVSVDPTSHELVIRIPRPRSVPSLSAVLSSSLKGYPAAAELYGA